MSSPLEPFPPHEVIWEGRPQVGVLVSDVKAGTLAFLVVFFALSGGLRLSFGAEWSQALSLGTTYGGIMGILVLLARAVGAGSVLTVSLLFMVPVAAGSLWQGQKGLSLVCPLSAASLLVLLLLLRFRQRVRTRYLVTSKRVALGEAGRYTITFTIDEAPVVVADRFGSDLGDVLFGRRAGTLTTRDGTVFKEPPRLRRLHRIRCPEGLLEALSSAQR